MTAGWPPRGPAPYHHHHGPSDAAHHPNDMKLATLAGAALLALTAAPASATPGYAYAIARSTCDLKASGLSQDAAIRAAIGSAWEVYGEDILRDGTDIAARFMVIQQSRLCSLK